VTDHQGPLTAECLRCGIEFVPRKAGHVFCSTFCRHRGELVPHERVLADPAQVERLFDLARDPDDQVRPDDWHPSPDSEFAKLDAGDTVAERRRWWSNLLREGLA